MFGRLCLLISIAVAQGAPPPLPRPYLPHHAPAPPQLHNYGPIDYFGSSPQVAQYYNEMVETQLHQKQGEFRQTHDSPSQTSQESARLENLDNPDSEVELLPGAQQPQQPPQQAPVNPNLPGLVPGQRVFIVHMPVPGYRPGSIGGYQPVYIVAAAPQGNPQGPQANPGYAANGYTNNGYQNAIFLSPQGQAVVSPVFGYPGLGPQSGLLVGAPLPLRGHEGYQNNFGYQQPQGPQGLQDPQGYRGPQGADLRGPVQFSQLLNLQGQPHLQGQPQLQGQLINLHGQPVNSPRSAGVNEAASNTDPKRVVSDEDSKEGPRRNTRPTPSQAQLSRNKA